MPYNVPINCALLQWRITRALSGGRLAHPEGQNENEIENKIIEIDGNMRKYKESGIQAHPEV